MSKVFLAVSDDGKFSLGSPHNRARFADDLKENPGARYRIERITPESRKQRGFYHGAVLSLWAYLNGWDYKDHEIIDFLHHEAKKEFNGEMVMLDGRKIIRGKSTKGKLEKYLDRIIDYLEEEYAIDRNVVLNNNEYKKWEDTIYPFGGPEHYLDYLIELNKIPAVYIKQNESNKDV